MEELELNRELEEPPGPGSQRRYWQTVPPEQWNDWRWQFSHRLNTLEELGQIIQLTPDQQFQVDGLDQLIHLANLALVEWKSDQDILPPCTGKVFRHLD